MITLTRNETMPTPKRGRTPDADPTVNVHLRLPRSVRDALLAIGRREGLTHGGLPSPTQVVAWLVRRDADGRGPDDRRRA